MSGLFFFFFSSRRRHTRSYGDWSSDVCSSDLNGGEGLSDLVGQVVGQGFSLFQGLRQGLGVGGGPADNGPTAEGVGPQDERPAVEKAVDTAGPGGRSEERRVGRGGRVGAGQRG